HGPAPIQARRPPPEGPHREDPQARDPAAVVMKPVMSDDDIAAPLDALLVDAAFGPLRRLLPDLSVVKLAGRLASRPAATAHRLGGLAAELARIGAGRSAVTPDARDRRFADPAWARNPLLRRLLQGYLATADTATDLV